MGAAIAATVTCPACRVVWVVPRRYAGRTVACRACGGPALADRYTGAGWPRAHAVYRSAAVWGCFLAVGCAVLAVRLVRP